MQPGDCGSSVDYHAHFLSSASHEMQHHISKSKTFEPDSLAHNQRFQFSRLLSADELVIFKKAIAMVLGNGITPDLLDVVSIGNEYAYNAARCRCISFSSR